MFSQFCTFLHSTSFASDSTLVNASNCSFKFFLFLFKNLELKFWHMVISDLKDSNDPTVRNKQLSNSKIETISLIL